MLLVTKTATVGGAPLRSVRTTDQLDDISWLALRRPPDIAAGFTKLPPAR